MNNIAENMLSYHHWANQTILNRLRELPSALLYQETASSYPTLAATLTHLYAVDQMWYLIVQGTDMPEALEQSRPLMEQGNDWSLEEFDERLSQQAQQYDTWIKQTDLKRTIQLNNPYVGVRQTSLEEIVLHLVNHGTYHRGNIATMLRQLGHSSVMNDYILFWYQQPETV